MESLGIEVGSKIRERARKVPFELLPVYALDGPAWQAGRVECHPKRKDGMIPECRPELAQ